LIESLKAQIVILQAEVERLRGLLLQGEIKIERDLSFGSSGDDVKSLQEFLKSQSGIYPQGLITGYFGSLTRSAVIRFQERYASEILNPLGLVSGTGIVGSMTRSKINQLK
jgi:peptidoglycan hydrolase-like protein with peptidoglycan-binding domain